MQGVKSNTKRGSAGGRVRAVASRKDALNRYFARPQTCKECESVIQPHANERPSKTRRRVFCSQSCAAKYNNRGTRRGPRAKVRTCPTCGNPFFGRSVYCGSACYMKRPKSLKPLSSNFSRKTKQQVFRESASWQAARSSIQRHARKMLLNKGAESACELCGYSKHVDVAHRRAVKDFPNSATIAEINDPKNLVRLCPNHHWEFDHGVLIL